MTSATAAKIATLAVERASSKSQARRNSLTRQIERLAQRSVIVPATQPAAAKRAPKPVVKDADAWLSRPATRGQLRRINALERTLGYKLSTAQHIGTGQDARNIYRALKAENAR